jgi:hypothetical protein
MIQADAHLEACMQEIDALATKYDARCLAAVLLARGAGMYRQLRMLGYETPVTLTKLFSVALQDALVDGERARVLTETGNVASGTKQ